MVDAAELAGMNADFEGIVMAGTCSTSWISASSLHVLIVRVFFVYTHSSFYTNQVWPVVHKSSLHVCARMSDVPSLLRATECRTDACASKGRHVPTRQGINLSL